MIILTKFQLGHLLAIYDAFVSNTLLDAVTADLKNHRLSRVARSTSLRY